MAREPSAHYKAMASEIEMLRKRENSNMKRIKALEDKVELLLQAIKSDIPLNNPDSSHQKPTKEDYDSLRDIVKQESPSLISLWEVYVNYGFASYRTVESIASNFGDVRTHRVEIHGRKIESEFVVESDFRAYLRDVICNANLKIEYDERDTFKSACLSSVKASVKKGSAGNFKIPQYTPVSWIAEIAAREALRECRTMKSYGVFIEGYTDSFGRALGMDIDDTRILIDNLIHSGKIIRDGSTIKAAS